MRSINTTKRLLIGILFGSLVAILISTPIMMLLNQVGVSLPLHFFAIAIAASVVVWALRWSQKPMG